MKKYLIYLLVFTFCFSLCTPVFGLTKTTGRIAATLGLKLRKGPTTNDEKIITVPHNTIVTIVSYSDTGNGCSDKWAEIIYEANGLSHRGYACSTFIEDIVTIEVEDSEPTPPAEDNNSDNNSDNSDNGNNGNNGNTDGNNGDTTNKDEETNNESTMANMTAEEFEAYLTSQGFPESYKVKLRELHKLHPSWVFVGIQARDNWATVLSNQNVSGRSLYQSKDSASQGYLATGDGFYDWYNDKFIAKDGSTWFQANSQTISYYMDPRNFLTESGIFMFEDLNYYSSYQTSNSVKAILYTEFYADLIQYYMEAATTYNVSPIYLAALSRQEVGLSAGYATSGTTSTYCSLDYTGYYNFYNIQATAGSKPVCNGLAYAKSVGWNSKQNAIVGGASWIVNGYINAGQNTAYFQKWNTSSNATKPYYHQYMSNIRAVVSSASTTKNSYSSMGIIDYSFVFQIPIYQGIPSSTTLPATGNPNNWLKSLKVNNTLVTNFDSEETEYTVNMPQGTKMVTVSATPVNSSATVIGIGNIELTELTTNVDIVVTAQNGNTRIYKLEIKRPEEIISPVVPDNELDKDDDENNNNNSNNNNNNDTNDSNNSDDKEDVDDNIITPVIPPKEEEKEEIIYPTPSETISKSGYKINGNAYIYNVTLGSTVQGIVSKLQAANQYASINITTNNNNSKTSGSLVTGDKITIVSNDISQTFSVVIYGDTNGDGEITTLDLLILQKHLLKKSTLTNAYLKSSDVNKDGKSNTLDLLIIQKHLLKKGNISQS